MGTRYYDKKGNLKGFSKTKKDQDEEGRGLLLLIFYSPLLVLCYFIFKAVEAEGVHPALALIGAIATFVAACFAIAKISIFRVIYAIAFSITASALSSYVIYARADLTWAAVTAILVLLITLYGLYKSRSSW